MNRQKFLIWSLCAALLLQTPMRAQAVTIVNSNTGENTENIGQNIVYNATAEKQNTTMSGQGDINTNIDTRTEEQKADDNKEKQRQELIDKIKDIYSQISDIQGQPGGDENGGDGGGDWHPDQDWNPDDIFKPVPDITLPEYTHPGYENPSYTLPDLPEWGLPNWELPEFALPEWPEYEPSDDYVSLSDGIKDLDKTYVIENPNGIFVVDQILLPIGTLVTLGNTYKGMNDKDISLPKTVVPSVTEEDGPRRGLTEDDLNQMYREWLAHIRDSLPNVSIEIPSLGPIPDDGYITPPSLDDLLPLPDRPGDGIFDTFPDKLPDTDFEVTVPKDTDALYELLMRYLRELMELGQSTIAVTRITQYQTRQYSVRTIRTATPLPDYRWKVTNSDGSSIETSTESRSLKMLFRGSGTYHVNVYNKQNVIRNNKVSGTKSEYWLLGNGDFYDGLLIYEQSSSFNAFIGTDIGPRIEEIELLRDGFNAVITPEMVNTVQLIDTFGNVLSPSIDHTTERER